MKNKITSHISFLLSLVILLSTLMPYISYAAASVDYKDLVQDHIATYGNFKTPESQFEIYVNGSLKKTSPITTSTVETVNALPESFTAKVGDQIRIKDISRFGSGTSIVGRDLQIGKNYTWNGPEEFKEYSTSDLTITADKPGTWVVYLNVRDNYSKIPNFQNWSQYGNWRTTSRPAYEPPGVQIEGWYFTAVKFTVEDTAIPKAEFEIHYNGQNKTDNSKSPVEVEKYPVNVNLVDKSTIEKGTIKTYEWGKKSANGSWQIISNSKSPTASINQDVETFRLRVESSDGKWSNYIEHKFYSNLKGTEPTGDIWIKIDVPSTVEEGKNFNVRQTHDSTYPVVKIEWFEDGSRVAAHDGKFEGYSRSITRDRTFGVKITDNKGNTAYDEKTVVAVDKVEPEIFANLMFDPEQTFRPVQISLDDYLANNEMQVKLWITGENSSYVGTELGRFYFFQNITDSDIRQYEKNESGASADPNFIERVDINTRDNPDSLRDASAFGTFKFRPKDPTIKASLFLRSRTVNGPVGFATAYHTVEFDIDSIPPETELSIPEPFYPKEIDNPKQKTITWSYESEQDIPYKHSVVSLYKMDEDGYFEEVFKDRIMTDRKLIVEGEAHEEYEIRVKVVDQIGKSSNVVSGQFIIIGAVPIIDLELDNKTNPDILRIEVFNKTPEEIESLFPTSYTRWTIHDSDNNLVVEGEGEAPKSVDLDDRFYRGKYTVTQHAINTLGITAKANKDFEITSLLDFIAEPNIQFEDDLIKLIDTSKYITNQEWFIRGNNDTVFNDLQLNTNNEFTRNEGIYQIKLKGTGYFEYVGEAEREVIKTVTFLTTKPVAAYKIGGNLKMYKEILLDGTISEVMTEARLQAKYPIQFDHEKTRFAIEPIKEPNGEVDLDRLNYILGEGKEIENNQVIFKGKKILSMRIDKDGWYRGYYKVYNGRKESDWYISEFYVSPELLPTVDINVGSSVVYRDPENELKSKLEVIVNYSSPDDEIDLEKSLLFVSYDKNNDGNFINDGIDNTQFIMKNSYSLLNYISTVDSSWQNNKATFNIYTNNVDKNFFGKFKFDFIAIEKPLISNKNDLGEAPIMTANTFLLDDKKKIILIDNDKPKIFLETTINNSFILYILEDSGEKFTESQINSIIQRLEIERVNIEVYIIDAEKDTIRKYQ